MSDPDLPGLMLGHYDASKTPTIEKVRAAAAKFGDTYKIDAEYVLVNMADAEELDGCEYEVRPVTYVSRYCFYIGLRP